MQRQVTFDDSINESTVRARRMLLGTARNINATSLTDLARRLKMSRQAIQQKAMYHRFSDDLKQIFNENKLKWEAKNDNNA